MVALLRAECALEGDNDWTEDLHLADVIEKHLLRKLYGQRDALAAALQELVGLKHAKLAGFIALAEYERRKDLAWSVARTTLIRCGLSICLKPEVPS